LRPVEAQVSDSIKGSKSMVYQMILRVRVLRRNGLAVPPMQQELDERPDKELVAREEAVRL
jgi:hypothetical protein